jgi:hypothetical protein
VIGDYTAFCSLIIEAAGRASVRRARPGSTP